MGDDLPNRLVYAYPQGCPQEFGRASRVDSRLAQHIVLSNLEQESRPQREICQLYC
jgi:hypothetical protein